MRLTFFVINLDRSPERLAAVQAEAEALGLSLIRVPAVDGKTVPPHERRALDVKGFRRLHGKLPLDGEYGCYASHLDAIDRISQSDADAGVVLEDDVRLLPELPEVLDGLVRADDWDVVRFAHHRASPFRRLRALPRGHALGVDFFGPTGSSAGYVVRREAAARLRTALTPMRLPFDVALERGWAANLRILDIRPNLVRFSPHAKKSLVAAKGSYDRQKLAPWRRVPTLFFRTSEAVRRVAFVLNAGRPRP